MEIQSTTCLMARESDLFRCMALEKRMAEMLPSDMAGLYLCSPSECVLYGSHQNPKALFPGELPGEGFPVVQRESGGGAAFLDPGCVCFALMLPKPFFSPRDQNFLIADALARLGVPTQWDARGGLWHGEKLVCAATYFKERDLALQEGVLYVDADLEKAVSLLGEEAAGSFGNLSALQPSVTTGRVMTALCVSFRNAFGIQPTFLEETLLGDSAVRACMRKFSARQYRPTPEEASPSFETNARYGWGSLQVRLFEENKVITRVELFTDAFETRLFEYLESALTGCIFLISAIQQRFEEAAIPLRNPRLRQIAEDVEHLVCGQMRQSDRNTENSL